jgi:acyl transferase domain-containing protein
MHAELDTGRQIPREAIPWPTGGARRISVQNFGFGGSNSHAILDDAYHFLKSHGLEGNHKTRLEMRTLVPSGPARNESVTAQQSEEGITNGAVQKLLVWSATDSAGIDRFKAAWSDVQFGSPAVGRDTYDLADVAFTLATRRNHLAYRAFAVVSSSSQDSTSANPCGSTGDLMSGSMRAKTAPQLAFVFTGQGSQWRGMGQDLMVRYDVFKQSLVEADAHFREQLGCSWSLLKVLYDDGNDGEHLSATSRLAEAEYSQPLCTALQVALVELLQYLQMVPSVVVGHSSGEIAAAFCSGAISRESAWNIAFHRGAVAAKIEKAEPAGPTTRGAMLAVGLSRTEVEPFLQQTSQKLEIASPIGLVVACENSPKSVTVSGDATHIDHLKHLLDAERIFARKLRVGVAYHSSQMQEVAAEYLSKIGRLPRPPNARGPRLISSVTGDWASPYELAKPEYWVRNLVSPVLFSDALSMCLRSVGNMLNVSDVVEIGPHSALQAPVREIMSSLGKDKAINYVSVLIRNTSAITSLLECIGRLHCLGYSPSLARANNEERKVGLTSLTNLPPYPFNHTRAYWHEGRVSKGYRFRRFGSHDLLGVPENDFNPLEAKWRHLIRPAVLPWVHDHKVRNQLIMKTT